MGGTDRNVIDVMRRFAATAFMLLVAGCSNALPTSENLTKSPWATFDDVKAAYDRVVLGTTTAYMLRASGFDPYASPNVRVLNYLDVMRSFLSGDAIRINDLHPAVQACIRAREACSAYSLSLEHLHRERKGSAMMDLFNFRRQTHETGWRFAAMFVIHNGVVSYKLWSGMPRIDRRLQHDNPLGPVREPADIIRSQMP